MYFKPLGKNSIWALYFSLSCGIWLGFKEIEPYFFPTVTEFAVEVRAENPNSLIVGGSFNKVRNCEFKQVIAYAQAQLIHIEYLGTKGKSYNRRTGKQKFGPWRLSPKSGTTTFHVTHECLTGEVVTKLGSVVFPSLL